MRTTRSAKVSSVGVRLCSVLSAQCSVLSAQCSVLSPIGAICRIVLLQDVPVLTEILHVMSVIVCPLAPVSLPSSVSSDVTVELL